MDTEEIIRSPPTVLHTPPHATHTNTKRQTAHTHTPVARRRAPQGPQPGVASGPPPPQPMNPSQEWRGTTPTALSQEWRGTNHRTRRRTPAGSGGARNLNPQPGVARDQPPPHNGGPQPRVAGDPHHTPTTTPQTHTQPRTPGDAENKLTPHHQTTPPTTWTPRTGNTQHSTATARGHTHHKHTQQETPPPTKHPTATSRPQPGVAGSRTTPPLPADPNQEWRGTAPRALSQEWRGTPTTTGSKTQPGVAGSRTQEVGGLKFDFAGTRRLSAPGGTWSGQVISPPPGPSRGPSNMHLLPGGGVPRVHRARSPVPPRLPRFATPQSVHQFAAVAAGAYPPRHPPNAWSPGAPAPPGPCYWLVASGTYLGWRGGCLA